MSDFVESTDEGRSSGRSSIINSASDVNEVSHDDEPEAATSSEVHGGRPNNTDYKSEDSSSGDAVLITDPHSESNSGEPLYKQKQLGYHDSYGSPPKGQSVVDNKSSGLSITDSIEALSSEASEDTRGESVCEESSPLSASQLLLPQSEQSSSGLSSINTRSSRPDNISKRKNYVKALTKTSTEKAQQKEEKSESDPTESLLVKNRNFLPIKMTSWSEIKEYCSTNKYSLYVLTMLMFSYLVNQLAVFCLIATNPSMSQELEYGDRECQPNNETAINEWLEEYSINRTADNYCLNVENHEDCNDHRLINSTDDYQVCYWRYLGTGREYQLLAGPFYIILYAISGIPMAMAAEMGNINRKWFLTVCLFMWSLVTMLGGFATQYWHVAICRLLLGIFGAACVPFSASLISDYFPPNTRAAAMGFFTWGIFVGYSLTYVLLIVEEYIGWRPVYLLAGIPGLILAVVIAPTVKEPERAVTDEIKTWSLMCGQLKSVCKYFCGAVLLIVSLGGAIRNGAGIVWAYNIVPFFDQYHPDTNVAYWMCWIPLVFGSTSALGGGAYADRMLQSWGMRGRLGILILFTLIATPFQAGVLLLPMPWAMFSHMVGYLFAEMWLGILLAVVVEQVPPYLSTSAVSVFFFIIQIIGGNMNLLITPITDSISLQAALMICFPGFYLVACVIFAFALPFVWNTEKRKYDFDVDDEVVEIDGADAKQEDGAKTSDLSIDNPYCNIDDEKQETSLDNKTENFQYVKKVV